MTGQLKLKRMPLPAESPGTLAQWDGDHVAAQVTLGSLVAVARTEILDAGYDPTDVGVHYHVGFNRVCELFPAGMPIAVQASTLVDVVAEAVLRLAVAERDLEEARNGR